MFDSIFSKLLLLFTLLIAYASPGLGQMRNAEQEPFIPGHLIIQVDENTDPELLFQRLPAQYEFKVNKQLSDHMRAWLVEFNPFSISQMEALKMVNRMDGITLAQNDHVVELRSTTPDDPQFDQQWHHLNTGQTGGTADADTDIDEAWDITTGGQNALGHDIVVCILEGVDFSHSDLIENRWTNPFEIPGNGIDDDGNGYIDDINGWNVSNNSGNLTGVSTTHGTNVAGMIGAKGNNNLGVVGANWDVKMMNVVGYSMTESSVVSAYDYPLSLRKKYNETNGTEGAFIVATNASWGIDGGNPNNYPIWCQFYDTLGKYGIVNCGATTNSDLNVDVSGDMPTACPSDYMVGVGRSGHNDNFAGGYGATTIDFPAPGISVRTTANGNSYTTTTGTSFSSPYTAGVIALLYSIPCPGFMNIVLNNPQDGSDLIYQALMDGVDLKANMTNSFIAGGRLNAKNSMDLLMEATCSTCTPPANPVITTVNDNTVTFTYDATQDVINYSVFVREEGSANWTQHSSSTLSIQVNNLNSCTVYEYYMSVECADESNSSPEIGTFSTTGCGACIDLTYCDASSTDPGEEVSVHTPSGIAGDFTSYTLTDNWGVILDNGYAYGNLILVDDGTAASEEGCNTLTNAAQINGNIAVAVRGTCNFSQKALNAQNAGATGLIIINNQGTSPASLGDGGEGNLITIPVVMVSQADGAGLLSELSGGNTVTGLLGSQNEWIESFEINGNQVVSGDDNGYRPAFLSAISSLDIGATYPFSVTPGFDGQPLLTYSRIWIDLNQDGTFTAGELVYDQSSAGYGVVTDNITIPANATPGTTRMRVQLSYQDYPVTSLPSVCGEYMSVETEDYCVELLQTQFCNLAITPTIIEPLCPENAIGSISVNVSGGTPGYTYAWNTGNTTSSLTGLDIGAYSLVVTDDSGCDTTIQYNLNYDLDLSVSSTITSPTCSPNEDGEISVNALGSSGFSYQWNTGATGTLLNDLAPGVYSVTATDGNGCIVNETFNLAYSSNLVLSATVTHPSCDDSQDGTVIASASGGSGITYQWQNGPSTEEWSNIGNGTYQITATSADGCQVTEDYTLLAAPAPVVADFVLTQNFLNVQFTSTSSNATSYSWDFGDGNSSSSQNPAHSYNQPGTYTVCLSVTGTCESSTTCYTVSVSANTTGIEENDEITFLLYPNPAKNEVSLVTSIATVEKIEVTTVTGQVVKQFPVNGNAATEMDIESLAEGIYLVTAYEKDGTLLSSQKLIVRK